MSIIRQRQKNLIMAWLLGVAMSGGVVLIILVFNSFDIDSIINKKQEEEVEKISIYVASKTIEKGTTIERAHLELVDYDEDLVPKEIVLETGSIIGSKALVKLSAKTPITSTFLYKKEEIQDDVREREYKMIYLPSKLKEGQYVDIRIGFPTGQDYIIASHKRIEDLNMNENESIVWLHLNEEELLSMSSAIVDAYIHEGTKIYMTTYLVPELQKKAKVNYPVNEKISDLILNNPNIVYSASIELETRKRQELEKALKEMKPEEKALVEAEQINSIEETISRLRNQSNINIIDNTQSINEEKKENENINTLISNEY